VKLDTRFKKLGLGAPFVVYINFERKAIYVGKFYDAFQAAAAYDDKAREVHGEFARLNFPERTP